MSDFKMHDYSVEIGLTQEIPAFDRSLVGTPQNVPDPTFSADVAAARLAAFDAIEAEVNAVLDKHGVSHECSLIYPHDDEQSDLRQKMEYGPFAMNAMQAEISKNMRRNLEQMAKLVASRTMTSRFYMGTIWP